MKKAYFLESGGETWLLKDSNEEILKEEEKEKSNLLKDLERGIEYLEREKEEKFITFGFRNLDKIVIVAENKKITEEVKQ